MKAASLHPVELLLIGGNASPALSWSALPNATRELVLLIEDIDSRTA